MHQVLRQYPDAVQQTGHEKIEEVLSLNLPLDMICTSHGIIWRDNPAQIVENYLKWADSYQENQITLIYDTMWNGTRTMSEAIARGIRQADPSVVVKQFNLANSDKNDVLTEVFKSKGILVGSPTVNNVMLPQVAGLLEEMQGLRFTGKAAAAFGSHGWSGGAVDRISSRLQDCGFMMMRGIKAEWKPTEDAVAQCEAFGAEFARQLGAPACCDSGCAGAEKSSSGKWICRTCSWVYDPELGEPNQGVPAGTAWEDVPDSFLCPVCLMGKDDFYPAD